MAGASCVKKFRNCEAAAAIASYQIQMEAFHWAIDHANPTDDQYGRASQIDQGVTRALKKAQADLIELGLEIAKN